MQTMVFDQALICHAHFVWANKVSEWLANCCGPVSMTVVYSDCNIIMKVVHIL